MNIKALYSFLFFFTVMWLNSSSAQNGNTTCSVLLQLLEQMKNCNPEQYKNLTQIFGGCGCWPKVHDHDYRHFFREDNMIIRSKLEQEEMQILKQFDGIEDGDQLVIVAGQDTEVLAWNNDKLKPRRHTFRPLWSESFVQWSPLGTYVATIHQEGVAIWEGSPSFKRQIMHISHPQVELIDFSPREKYLVTYSSHESSNPGNDDRAVLNIFEVRTGMLITSFEGTVNDFTAGGNQSITWNTWPIIKWLGGNDDLYFAQMNKRCVSIYEARSGISIGNHSLSPEDVIDFSWSPTEPVVVVVAPELPDQPARISLFAIPSKEELWHMNFFGILGCRLYWQSNGEYLAAQLNQYSELKNNSTFTSLDLFQLKEGIPIKHMNLDNVNGDVFAFSWEPNGCRFAVVHGDDLNHDVSFYMISADDVVKKLKTLGNTKANTVYWSPTGRYVVCEKLEFYDVDKLEIIATVQQSVVTDIQWDPTGRFVATSVTSKIPWPAAYRFVR